MITMMPQNAFAQANQSLWSTYFPIAELFDSEVFFWIIIGSALLFLLASIIFIMYTKKREQQVEAWAKEKSTQELLDLLDSPLPRESTDAFMYLRHHGDEKMANQLVERIKQQKKSGKVNPYLIYLLEDYQPSSGIPTLQSLAKGKSKTANIARDALHRFGVQPADE